MSIQEGDMDDITFEYEGDWEEIMADARPAILAQVDILKNQ